MNKGVRIHPLLHEISPIGDLTVKHDDGKICQCVCACGVPVVRKRDALLNAIQGGRKPACKDCLRKRIRRLGQPVQYYRGTTRMAIEPSADFAVLAVKR